MKQDFAHHDGRGAPDGRAPSPRPADSRRRGYALSLALVALVLAISAGVGLWAFLYGGRDMLADLTAQEPRDTEAVSGLDLEVGAAYVTERFGPARTVVDACSLAPCPDPAQAGLTLSVHAKGDVLVRALTQGDQLQAYLLTTTSHSYRPSVGWLRRPLGAIGGSTAAEMLDAMGPDIQPTDTAIAVDPRPVWVDVVAVGAPGNYRGVILAWSPEGSGDAFDADAAAQLAASGDGGLNPEVLDQFRATTTPNTVGHFRDRGPVAAWLHEAATVSALLLTGSGI